MTGLAAVLAITFLVTFLLSSLLTFALILVADKFHFIAQPTSDRWHKKATPILGGVAMFLSFVIGFGSLIVAASTFHLFSSGEQETISKLLLPILLTLSGMFLLGLIDDFLHVAPHTKLLWQIVAALMLSLSGIRIHAISNELLAIPLTVVWLVGITNALNLLDNMDGLAGGIALIASITFAILGFANAQTFVAFASPILAAAILGFLLFNLHPAKIFMGDTGSMFLGFSLGSFALLGTWREASNVITALLVPLLVLAIPIFDTTLVSINRTLSGKKVTDGGRDHSSHRLVALGLSEKRSVRFLLAISAILSTLAVLSHLSNSYYLIVLTGVAIVGLALFGIYLSDLNVYNKDVRFELLQQLRRYSLFDAIFLYKKQLFELVVDCNFIALCYFLAYLIKYDSSLSDPLFALFLQSLPWVLVVKLAAFAFFDPYNTSARFFGLYDLLQLVKAVLVGSLLTVFAVVFLYKFNHYSRSVFVIDAMLSLLFLSGYRLLLRLFNEYLFARATKAKNVLIIGASDVSDAFIRYLKISRSQQYRPVGFLDDDKKLVGRRIAGIPVLGNLAEAKNVFMQYEIDEVIYWNHEGPRSALDEIKDLCRVQGVELKRAFSLMYTLH